MEIIRCIFILVFGTLGHFIFEWSGHRRWAGMLFAVNESTWEHIKLTIYPSFFWAIGEGIATGFDAGLVVSCFASTAVMMALIPALFYGYTAITGKNWLITDIICFILAIVGGGFTDIFVKGLPSLPTFPTVISICGLAAVLAAYLTFSYNPPHNFLFRDPISKGFGPTGHDCHSHFHGV